MRAVYCSTDTQNGPARAQALGCGYLDYVPPGVTASMPCVVVAGGDPFAVVVISDSPPTTLAAVNAVTGPMLTQEAAGLAAQATQTGNQRTITQNAHNALTNNATYIALASPSTAQNTAQIKALTQQADALIRLAVADYTATT